MTLFWFLAGILSTLATLVMVLPWLRRIPRLSALPALPWPVTAGAALSMAVAVVLYHWLGHPQLANTSISPAAQNISAAAALVNAPIASATDANSSATASAGSMSSAIAALQGRLAKGGGSADDWELLAKSYEFIGRPDDASKVRAHQLPPLPADLNATAPPPASPAAFAAPEVSQIAAEPTLSADSLKQLAKAARARHDEKLSEAAAIYAQLAARGQMNADSWADYADTAASLQGGKLAGAAEGYVGNALAQNPQHPKALWLQASADEEAGRFDRAVLAWRRLQNVLPANSADAKIVAANLQQDMGLAGAGSVGAGISSKPPAASGTAVSGEVSLAAALNSKAAPGATLFIVAKSVDSPGMPVAVFRGTVGAWPVKFTLDDSQSMFPGRNLSSAGRVRIEARISQSGQPLPATGDLQGSSGVIDPSEHQSLKIIIDHVIS